MNPKEQIREFVQDCTRHGFGKEAEDAARLFYEWRKAYPLGFWGTTLSREQHFPREGTDDAQILADTYETGEPFTLRVDWKTMITEGQCNVIKSHFPYMELEPGVWIHDYKTASSKEYDLQELYQNDPQGFCYTSAYNALHPDSPCRGAIFHRCIITKAKTKPGTISFQHAAIEHTERRDKLAKQFLKNAAILKATDMCLGLAQNCRYMYSTCEYMGSCTQL